MKIICVGRNYSEHAKELNNEVPKEPVIFLKPDTALLRNNQPFYIPSFSKDMHHELELVVKICRLGRSIDEKFAHRYYKEIAIGIDFTARDKQNELKAKGLPWELAKAFDYSAAISPFTALGDRNIQDLDLKLDVNGQTRQQGNTRDMLFSVDRIIAFVSQYFTLKIGDLIYTGTPPGVAAVAPGDRLEGYLGTEKLLDFDIR